MGSVIKNHDAENPFDFLDFSMDNVNGPLPLFDANQNFPDFLDIEKDNEFVNFDNILPLDCNTNLPSIFENYEGFLDSNIPSDFDVTQYIENEERNNEDLFNYVGPDIANSISSGHSNRFSDTESETVDIETVEQGGISFKPFAWATFPCSDNLESNFDDDNAAFVDNLHADPSWSPNYSNSLLYYEQPTNRNKTTSLNKRFKSPLRERSFILANSRKRNADNFSLTSSKPAKCGFSTDKKEDIKMSCEITHFKNTETNINEKQANGASLFCTQSSKSSRESKRQLTVESVAARKESFASQFSNEAKVENFNSSLSGHKNFGAYLYKKPKELRKETDKGLKTTSNTTKTSKTDDTSPQIIKKINIEQYKVMRGLSQNKAPVIPSTGCANKISRPPSIVVKVSGSQRLQHINTINCNVGGSAMAYEKSNAGECILDNVIKKIEKMKEYKRTKQIQLIDSVVNKNIKPVTNLPLFAEIITPLDSKTSANDHQHSEYEMITTVNIGCNTLPPVRNSQSILRPLEERLMKTKNVKNLPHNSLLTSIKREISKKNETLPLVTCESELSSSRTILLKSNSENHGENRTIRHLYKNRKLPETADAIVQTNSLPEYPKLPYKKQIAIQNSIKLSTKILQNNNSPKKCARESSMKSAENTKLSSSSGFSLNNEHSNRDSPQKLNSCNYARNGNFSNNESSDDSQSSKIMENQHSEPRYQRTNSNDNPDIKRRVIYVGNLEESTNSQILRQKFEQYGEIIKSSVHYKPSGMKYGFVTFVHQESALDVLDKGFSDPIINMYDLAFGERRKFCKRAYFDLDSEYVNICELSTSFERQPKKDEEQLKEMFYKIGELLERV